MIVRRQRYAFVVIAGFAGSCARGAPRSEPSTEATSTIAAPSISLPSSEPSARPQAGEPKHCLDPDEQGCTRRCAAGDEVSCYRLAAMYNKVVKTAVGDHPEKSRTIVEASCSRGYGPACAYLATLRDHGWGGPKDHEGAEAAQKKALSLDGPLCDGGDPSACEDLEDAYATGEGVGKDKEKSKSFEKKKIELYRVECEAGDPAGCTHYGVLGDHAEYVQRGCDHGDAWGCYDEANDWKYGNDRAKDPAKARTLFDKACKANLIEACGELK